MKNNANSQNYTLGILSRLLFWFALCIICSFCLSRLNAFAQETKSSVLSSPEFGNDFSKTWFDGNAEIATYALTFERYGSQRLGNAVSIFVTEDFSKSKRVKADPDKTETSDRVGVMKLNLIRDFPTGVYDYNTMLSTFISTAPLKQFGRGAGFPLKISFSSQEWCGHVYQQLLPHDSWLSNESHSYFDGEADRMQKLDYPKQGIFADSLFHWARNFAAPLLKPGTETEGLLFGSLMEARLSHIEAQFSKAKFSIEAKTETTKAFEAVYRTRRKTVETENGRTYTFWVEDTIPHRIIKWTFARDKTITEEALLVTEKRLPYWKMNDPNSINNLRELGLEPRNRMSP